MMVLMLAVAAVAAPPEVVVVGAPGLVDEAYVPLVQALRAQGAQVSMVSFPCSGDSGSLGRAIVRSAAGREVVLVSHGLGATLALQVAGDLHVVRWVLLGPVLGAVDNAAIRSVVDAAVKGPVDLSVGRSWGSTTVQSAVLGPRWADAAGCLSPQMARQLQSWVVDGVVLDLESVTAPVWVSVGALDELSPVEVLLPGARRFQHPTVVRPGLGRMDRVDLDHLGLLYEPFSVRLAANAAVRGW
jgi:hypothetical protein